jgi:hypothetical protein
MLNKPGAARFPRIVAALLLMGVVTGGCHWYGELVGEYSGPMPAKADLSQETVIVRSFSRDPAGPEAGKLRNMHLDRVRYIQARDFDDVNRVVLGETGELTAHVESLNLAVGDTVVVSGEYQGVYRGGAASGVVPNWPGDRYVDYPVAVHRLLEIKRKSP